MVVFEKLCRYLKIVLKVKVYNCEYVSRFLRSYYFPEHEKLSKLGIIYLNI